MNVNLNSGKIGYTRRLVIVSMSKHPAVLAGQPIRPLERHSGYCGPTTLDTTPYTKKERVHMENVDDATTKPDD